MFLFSGGNEDVLVNWRLDSTNKQRLPRMNSAIRFIVNAPDNASMATSHEETMGSATVVSAAFVRQSNALMDGPEWLVQSNLLIIDEQQHFDVLDDEDADTSGSGDGQKRNTSVSHLDSLPWTPFVAMQAQHQVSLVRNCKEAGARHSRQDRRTRIRFNPFGIVQ